MKQQAAPRQRRRLRACPECDLVVEMPLLKPGEHANCPRCQHPMLYRPQRPLQGTAATCLAAIFMLTVSLPFQFASFEVGSSGGQIDLVDAALGLAGVGQAALSIVVLLTILVLPGLYLIAVAYLHFGLLLTQKLPMARKVLQLLKELQPWMMADVFLLAALVALIKVSDEAEVAIGLSFWAFCIYVILLIKTGKDLNYDGLWTKLAGPAKNPAAARVGQTARHQQLQSCTTCGQLVEQALTIKKPCCPRCGSDLPQRHKANAQISWALLLTSALLYIPANIMPIMQTTKLGDTVSATIMGGIVILWEHGEIPIALIIFLASIVVPLVKMAILGWLCLLTAKPVMPGQMFHYRLYQVIEFIGRWSMVDVFVVAILVALVQDGQLLSVLPGPAALAFCSVVILTMLATLAFDPHLIWRPEDAKPTKLNAL